MTKLVLPNGTPLQLVFLYRSPSTPIDTFVNVLNTITSQIQLQSIPTVIMGDMNDSLMDTGISRITTVLSVSGFTQLVTSPTTDKGTLIDHVYYNGPLDGVIVEVSDTYYSDHDAVFLSIPIVSATNSSLSVIEKNTVIEANACLPSPSNRKRLSSVLDKTSIINSESSVNNSPSSKKKCLSNIIDQNQITTSIDHSPSIQTISWPQFRFFQVNVEWQRQWCSKLGLPYCSTYERSIGSSNTILTRPDRQSVRVMIGDGNCLFRSLSCVLTGSQQHHLLVRSLICNHMSSITHLLLPHIHPCNSVEDYITRTKMDNNLVWGTDIEIFTFANMCQTKVYVFSVQQSNWSVFTPTLSLRNIVVSTQSVYLLHPQGHYDLVTSVSE